MEYFDITPEISEKTAVWPGDTHYRRTVSVDFTKGDHFLLSSIQTTVHLGAHADAPNHYHPNGQGISERDLRFYLGTAQVIEVSLPRGQRIQVSHLKGTSITAKRVLLKTSSFPDPAHWNSDFNALSPDLVDYLYNQGVILIGIDTPSIDLFDDKELISHRRIYKNDMAVLEGVVLTEVSAGIYELVALPLKLKNADASPVRAILIKSREGNS